MKIEVDEEYIVPQIMLDDLRMVINSIKELKDREYLEEYQWRDLEYDLNLLQALKTVYRHYTIRDDWAVLDNYSLEVDHDLTETEWQ